MKSEKEIRKHCIEILQRIATAKGPLKTMLIGYWNALNWTLEKHSSDSAVGILAKGTDWDRWRTEMEKTVKEGV